MRKSIKWCCTIIIFVFIFIILGIAGIYCLYPQQYNKIVCRYSEKYHVDPLLIYAIIKVESKNNTHAVSRSGAKGLMQIMDRTGEWGAKQADIKQYSHEGLFEPEINLQIGCWYISKLLKQYDGDVPMALAAYNAGTGNVAKWRQNALYSLDGRTIDNIPFKETRAYVEKVQWHYKVYKFLYRNEGGKNGWLSFIRYLLHA